MRGKSVFYKVLIVPVIAILAGQSIESASAADLDCKLPYTVASGDTLSEIAERAYDNSSKYNLIYYANKDKLPRGPSAIRLGQKLRIPCADSGANAETNASESVAEGDSEEKASVVKAPEPKKAADPVAAPARSSGRKVELLTAGDYKPFTDPSLPGGGLITELLETSLKNSDTNYRLNWINDWAAHMDPLLSEKKYDVGFPWYDPGCPQSDSPRCQFLFSKPIFELLIVLFTRADQPMKFVQDADIMGKTLCRPAGYFTHDLDNNGRNWFKDGKVSLKQPTSMKDCFDMLMDGEVDAVAINDFTGRESMAKLGLMDKVIPLERELSIEGLHAIVHKTHPRATILINRINRGLDKLHASGQYDEIMDRHLLNHWKSVESVQ